MLKRLLILLLSLGPLTGFGQSVAGINFRHLYSPQSEINLFTRLVNDRNQLTLYFKLEVSAQYAAENYFIRWTKFESFTEKDKEILHVGDSSLASGKFVLPLPEKPWLLIGTVLQYIDSKYPVDGYLESADGIVFKPYVNVGKEYTLHGYQSGRELRIYFYKTDFPVASPPFMEKGFHIDRFMFADSTFRIPEGQKVSFKSEGLYLVEQDTVGAHGYAFRAVSGAYPKLNRISDIPDPLIFVCAKEEHDELLAAGDDKTKVDKVILDITRDKDRAKSFMRGYFRQVELANTYFTSFKEGWKTDRGMMYVIFGLPDEVSRTGQNEIWFYKNLKERFTFVKTGSVYDPDNYVLLRSAKFTELWYETIDLWRKSRF
jgi:GWxTD domain-containing protein